MKNIVDLVCKETVGPCTQYIRFPMEDNQVVPPLSLCCSKLPASFHTLAMVWPFASQQNLLPHSPLAKAGGFSFDYDKIDPNKKSSNAKREHLRILLTEKRFDYPFGPTKKWIGSNFIHHL